MVWADPSEASVLIPAVWMRGGDAKTGIYSGVFTANLNFGPTRQRDLIGFRCCLSR
jgi:hypothetical protein